MALITNTTNDLSAANAQPRGGRIGVAFDWGFAVQLAISGVSSLIGRPVGPALPMPAALGSLAFAAVMVTQGEALRRGNGVARRVQIGFHSLLVLAGIAAAVPTVQGLQQGRFAMLYTLSLLLGVSSTEIWLLLQPGSRQWYGNVSPEAAKQRHSGGWLVGTIGWAIVCGIFQALVAAQR